MTNYLLGLMNTLKMMLIILNYVYRKLWIMVKTTNWK